MTKRMVELAEPLAEVDVQRARHAINAAATGLRGHDAPDAISGLSAGAPSELTELIERVAEAVRSGVADPDTRSRGLFVGGTSALAAEGQFARLEQVKRVYETLEEQVVVLQVLQDALADADPMHEQGQRGYVLQAWRLNEGAPLPGLRLSARSFDMSGG